MDNRKLDIVIKMELEHSKILILHSNTSNYQLIKETQMDNIA